MTRVHLLHKKWSTQCFINENQIQTDLNNLTILYGKNIHRKRDVKYTSLFKISDSSLQIKINSWKFH